jgi:hypothetical protein
MHTAVISPLGVRVYSYLFPSFITSMLLLLFTPVHISLLSCCKQKNNLVYKVPILCTDFRSYWLCVYTKYTDREGIFGPDYKDFLIASLL